MFRLPSLGWFFLIISYTSMFILTSSVLSCLTTHAKTLRQPTDILVMPSSQSFPKSIIIIRAYVHRMLFATGPYYIQEHSFKSINMSSQSVVHLIILKQSCIQESFGWLKLTISSLKLMSVLKRSQQFINLRSPRVFLLCLASDLYSHWP